MLISTVPSGGLPPLGTVEIVSMLERKSLHQYLETWPKTDLALTIIWATTNQ